jgi:N-(2-amino-2-carboxyethyl)-L-glutamate synthase
VTTPTKATALVGQMQPTPMVPVWVTYQGGRHDILLKRECYLPSGSIKYRTAFGLVRAMDSEDPIRPGTVVVESTSGGLGIALSYLLAPLGCQFIAVIDPKTPMATRRQLAESGAVLHLITKADVHGDYLHARLRAIREIREANPHYRWANQYSNLANPLIHQQTTGPEIVAQAGSELDAIYVAVSTGGTLAGIAAYIRPLRRHVRLVAVDAQGSIATTPQPGSLRYIPGIGASRRSAFLRPDSYDSVIHIRDSEAIAVCHIFYADTMIRLGGSSGHVVKACITELAGPRAPVGPVCLCADDGERYADTIYSPGWIAEKQLTAEVDRAIRRLRGQGLGFGMRVP